VKYYIYVSDTKVDMLYAQIPQKIKSQIATELKIDLKLLSATFKDKSSQETRYSKLKLVVDYIEKNFEVGTVDKPKSYFRGKLDMGVGLFRSAACFGGKTKYSILCLGGSNKHVIFGHLEKDTTGMISPSSGLTSILDMVLDISNSNETIDPIDIDDRISESIASATDIVISSSAQQKLEFLAKRFAEGYSKKKKKMVVTGSPIYVALAE
jgi:hypothetical protein